MMHMMKDSDKNFQTQVLQLNQKQQSSAMKVLSSYLSLKDHNEIFNSITISLKFLNASLTCPCYPRIYLTSYQCLQSFFPTQSDSSSTYNTPDLLLLLSYKSQVQTQWLVPILKGLMPQNEYSSYHRSFILNPSYPACCEV